METDPITAALPPNSNYFIYLTVLKYQLTPKRLLVSTRRLAKDDSTLAKNIGWDLCQANEGQQFSECEIRSRKE